MSLTIPNLVSQMPFCYLNFISAERQKFGNDTYMYDAHVLTSSKMSALLVILGNRLLNITEHRLWFYTNVQSNSDSSNTVGFLPWLIRTHVLSPYKTLSIAQENKYTGKFSYFIKKLYVECTHKNRLSVAILISTVN